MNWVVTAITVSVMNERGTTDILMGITMMCIVAGVLLLDFVIILGIACIAIGVIIQVIRLIYWQRVANKNKKSRTD